MRRYPLPALADVPPAASAPLTQTQLDRAKVEHLQNSPSGIDQLHSPLTRGVLKALDTTALIAGSVFRPLGAIEQAIPGTQGHHEYEVERANRRYQQDIAQDQAAQNVRHTQAETDALGRDKLRPVQTDEGLAAFDPNTGTGTLVSNGSGGVLGAPVKAEKPLTIEEQTYASAMRQTGDPVKALGMVYGAKKQKDPDLPQQYLDAIASGDETKAALIRRVINDTKTQPSINLHTATERAPQEPHQMVFVPDGNGGQRAMKSLRQ